jgi:DNA polymerase-1
MLTDKCRKIVDSNNALHRFFHGMPFLSSPDGIPTHALTGFIRFLWKIEDEFGKENIHVVFDAPGGSSPRKDRLAELGFGSYKGERGESDGTLDVQLDVAYGLCTDMGYQSYRVDDVEADDVMYTLATDGEPALLFSHDKDLCYAVSDNCLVIKSKSDDKGHRWVAVGEADVTHKFGVTPSQMPQYLALAGDASDNIPGLPGVGPKTAVKWLAKHGTAAAALAAPDLPDRYREFASKIGGLVDVCTPKRIDKITTLKVDPDHGAVTQVLIALGMANALSKYRQRTGCHPQFKLPD